MSDQPSQPVKHLRKGSLVRFKIENVILPEACDVAMKICGSHLIQGFVADISDKGLEKEAVAVIHVNVLAEPVLVLTQHLEEIN